MCRTRRRQSTPYPGRAGYPARDRVDSETFWQGLAQLLSAFMGRNEELLAIRETLQVSIDSWHREHAGDAFDAAAYKTTWKK